jgi:hypothetical protein
LVGFVGRLAADRIKVGRSADGGDVPRAWPAVFWPCSFLGTEGNGRSEESKVYVVVPGVEEVPRFHIASPRLAQPELAAHFVKEVTLLLDGPALHWEEHPSSATMAAPQSERFDPIKQ